MGKRNVKIGKEGHTAIVTVNRPKKLNALNKDTIADLHQAFSELDATKDVKAIILTGSGQKAFVAGADIAEFSSYSVAEGKALAAKGQQDLFDYVENLSKPVIAAINGYALGGGLELAMACHIRLASFNAKMGLPEVSLGLIPGYGGTQRLPRLVGTGRAFELILTAGMISADKALEYGLLNQVVALEELLPNCKRIADRISNNSPVAISHAIKAVNASFKKDTDGYAVEIKAFGDCFGTADFQEGTTAFLEKRKAEFPGE